ncbi:DUF885 domain-containing protein [Polyangium jinanense]|uniref:DUF885 domain-containing protein n=1 Tax=Polyangium jinanense TaxID=2829994 RepID=A0A9X4AWW1_9BACT|nr:DUF885 domain-containing protein [Polyangium jinanense]MDC3961375.1 DUF885 domain-containing protein [Polyangium jinanense]MDC3987754.1 DUF885 domain-containing protein [Polyangium jinanense]
MNNSFGPVFALSDALLEDIAARRPTSATFWAVRGHDHAWDDFGPEGAESTAAMLASYRRQLDALPAPERTEDRIAARVMRDFLDVELDRIVQGDHIADLNNIASPFQHIRMVLDVMDTSSRAGWESMITRLSTIDRATSSYRRALEAGLRRGKTVAVRQVDAALAQGRVHAGEASFFRTLAPAFAQSSAFDPALAGPLECGIEHARRAYGELTEWLEQTYRPAARAEDGVGEEVYARKARSFLGISIDLRETFAWGFAQIREIDARMREIAAEIQPGASVDEVIRLLETDPARCAHGPDDLVRVVAEWQTRAVEALAGVHFDIPTPARRVDVKLAPPGSTIGAYYMPPSDDFSRPGTIWYSPGEREQFPLYMELSRAYHEGFPGHHLQLSMQVSFQHRLSRQHRVVMSDYQTGYAEGWALYAERLMDELGFLSKPEYVLGLLVCQMMRACRVVLDIGAHLGLHAPPDAPFRPGARIDYAYGVEMLTRVGRTPPDHAASEMTRYLGWPGQAIAYKVGEREILGLRDELRARQGSSFDLKTFHADLLGVGSVGLGALRELLLS